MEIKNYMLVDILLAWQYYTQGCDIGLDVSI